MSRFISNIGNAEQIMQWCLEGLTSIDSRVLQLDQPRSLEVIRVSRQKDEIVFRCRDSQSTVLIHIPFPTTPLHVAQASVIIHTHEEE